MIRQNKNWKNIQVLKVLYRVASCFFRRILVWWSIASDLFLINPKKTNPEHNKMRINIPILLLNPYAYEAEAAISFGLGKK